MNVLLESIDIPAETDFTEWLIPELIDALRDSPAVLGRLMASEVLRALATTLPAARTTIANAGAMGLVLAFLVNVGQLVWDKEEMRPAWDLGHALLCWKTAAVHDLRRAICGPGVELAYITLIILKVRLLDRWPHPPIV